MQLTRCLGLVGGLLALASCEQARQELEQRARPTPTASAPAPAADPALVAAEAAAREAQFAARPTVAPPAGLPSRWRALPEQLRARLTGARIHERTGKDGVRALHLQLRILGRDAAVERDTLAALKGLGLARVPASLGPEGTAEGPGWSLEIGRLKAPPGVAREHRVEISWQRLAPDPTPQGECKQNLPAVDAPPPLPGWLGRATRPQLHRWRVAREISAYPKLDRIRLWMLYRTGYTQDEHVGQLQAAAAAEGFTRVEGAGPTQRWRHADGQTLSWRPFAGPLGLRCQPGGPAIELSWERASDAP